MNDVEVPVWTRDRQWQTWQAYLASLLAGQWAGQQINIYEYFVPALHFIVSANFNTICKFYRLLALQF